MKRKIILRIFLGAFGLVLIGLLVVKVVVEPWMVKKINTSLNEIEGDYQLKVDRVHVSIFTSSIKLVNISLTSKKMIEGVPDLNGAIETTELKGVQFIRGFFRKEITIKTINIYNIKFIGKVAFPAKARAYIISPINFNIANLHLENIFVDVKSTTTEQTYLVKEGDILLTQLSIQKLDTLTPHVFGGIDFEAAEIITVTADSLYTISAYNINYSPKESTLNAGRFQVSPNYSEYDFTSLNPFQKDRIEANLSGITFNNFSMVDYIKSRDLISTYIEIEKMELLVFKDKRKPLNHVERPTFQQMIYKYPAAMNIDSLAILYGDIIYTEHSDAALSKGTISFNKINAQIYNITNDTIYKKDTAYLELNTHALLMDKSEINISLKARIFDSLNSFTVNGTLDAMQAALLNPILEKSVSTSITSGKINSLSFNFSANDYKANGDLIILYEDLHFTIINQHAGEKIALKDQLKSLLANIVVLESNPMPGKAVRPGTIDFKRDPEKFLFGYIFKSILSGIKSTMTRNPNGMSLSINK